MNSDDYQFLVEHVQPIKEGWEADSDERDSSTAETKAIQSYLPGVTLDEVEASINKNLTEDNSDAQSERSYSELSTFSERTFDSLDSASSGSTLRSRLLGKGRTNPRARF